MHPVLSTVIIAAIVLLLSGSSTAQQISTSFLEVSPSIRGSAMGGAGVSLVDPSTVTQNPAVISLLEDQYLSLGFLPLGSEANGDGPGGYIQSFSALSFAYSLAGRKAHQNGGLSLSTGMHRVDLDARSNYYYYDYPDYYSRSSAVALLGPDNIAEAITFAGSYHGNVSVGAGITAKRLRLRARSIWSSGPGPVHEGVAFDFGFVLRWRPHQFPRVQQGKAGYRWSGTFGIAVTGLGPNMRSEPLTSNYFTDFELSREPLTETKVELMEAVSLGITNEVAYIDPTRYGGWKRLSLLLSLEWEDASAWDNQLWKFGAELALQEAIALRCGTTRLSDHWGYGRPINYTAIERINGSLSFGCSIHTLGIARMLRCECPGSITR